MNKEEKDLLNRLKKFRKFMCNDIERTMFCARANFLVAMAIFNYIEILGGFMIGHYVKENGTIKCDKNGNQIENSCTDKFNAYLFEMGAPYQTLVNAGLRLYDVLRNGLTHEYLLKNDPYVIRNPKDGIMTDEDMLNSAVCGVLHHNNQWIIINPRLYIDFRNAFDKLIKDIEGDMNMELRNNFIERAKKINMGNFS